MLETISVIIIIILTILIRRGMKGIPRSMSNLKSMIEQLLRRGYDGGTLVIDHTKSKKFVQFRKYIKKKGVYGIELIFPLTKVNIIHYQEIRTFVESHNLVSRTEKWNPNDEFSFYCIDFRKESDIAHEFVKFIFIKLWELEDKEMFYTLLENASLADELITQ